MAVPVDDGKSNGPETPPYLEGAFVTASIGPMGVLHRTGKYSKTQYPESVVETNVLAFKRGYTERRWWKAIN